MNVQQIAAFCDGAMARSPAGVVLCDVLPDATPMQAVAAKVGYSETVFAAATEGGWRVRYFTPQVEVDFCGHATIALGRRSPFGRVTGSSSLNSTRPASRWGGASVGCNHNRRPPITTDPQQASSPQTLG